MRARVSLRRDAGDISEQTGALIDGGKRGDEEGTVEAAPNISDTSVVRGYRSPINGYPTVITEHGLRGLVGVL